MDEYQRKHIQALKSIDTSIGCLAILLLIAVILLWTGCSTLFAPSEIVLKDEWPTILREWKIAQDKLYERGVWRAHLVGAEAFTFRSKPGPFMCGDIWANGCYEYPSQVITWNRQKPHVIRHEAGHAILRRLGYSCSSCYEHPCGPCPKN
jgi:hypothetical protein